MPSPSTIEAGGVALRVEESGAGPPVVLVHGIACDRTVWRETAAALEGRARTIAYDRRGYGASGAPEPYGGTTVGEQADDLVELIARLDAAPAVLCGHHLGALICLDVLVRQPALASAAVLVETPMLWLSARGPDVASRTREAVEAAARERGAAGAVDAFLEDVAGAAGALGPERTRSAERAARAFAADLGAAASWAGGRRELRRLAPPVTLVHATRSPPIFAEVTVALGRLIPGASIETIDCGHFVQIEAPAELARLIASRLRRGD